MKMHKTPVVLVTGSTSGIGLEIARKFVDEGCSVIQNAREFPEKNRLIGSDFFAADVTKKEECKTLSKDVLSKYKNIDILICNVGSGTPLRNVTSSNETWNHYLSVNLFSTTNIIDTFLPLMHNGKVIAISSICGSDLIIDAPIEYSVAKAALNHYMQLLALKYAKSGHMLNIITPGNVNFPGSRWSDKLNDDEAGTLNYINENVPLGNFIEASEIADLAFYLTSSANKSITGSIIPIDGGQGL
jgi:3-oxoacyl-[acyl-carrier protein] reductase